MRPEGLPAHRLQLFDLKQMANYPLISALISDQDEDMLSYMINLEILCKDLWHNPLQYYKRMKPPEEGTEISGDFWILR
nr:testis-specific Y-encoded protein 2-like [Pan paniscus]XP_054963150.1 testis-specific Y-encoded protein 2-like [Pan paniscus]XP_054963178.1 testis-specific Y-encoded protein 2-like [Pan paniscus]